MIWIFNHVLISELHQIVVNPFSDRINETFCNNYITKTCALYMPCTLGMITKPPRYLYVFIWLAGLTEDM